MLLAEDIRIRNFRCLRDVKFKLGAFTVIVGPNASGKTALADALVASNVSGNDFYMRKERPAFWHANANSSVPQLFGGRRVKYTFTPARLRQTVVSNTAWEMDPLGALLANLFDTLSRAQQQQFVADFTKLVPVYQDVTARAANGKHHLEFQDRWNKEVWYQPHQISDGSILAAAFVALGYQRDVPDLAVFEDPDHGLHPYLQRHVVELFRKLSKGEIGPKPIQIVCTTHSKALLDILQPQEVLFLSRDRKTGETLITPAPTDEPNWTKLYDKFQGSLGDIWMTGAIGGVPSI